MILVVVGVSGFALWMLFAGRGLSSTPRAGPAPAVAPEPPAGASLVAGPGAVFRHPDGFSLTPPAGWVPQRGQEPTGVKVAFQSTAEELGPRGRFASSVSVVTEPVGTRTLDGYVRESTEVLRRAFPGVQLIDDARVQTTARVPAHILGWTFVEEEVTYRVKQLLLVQDGTGYAVTGTGLAATWDARNSNALFDRALASLSFVPP